jgi:hypothetical protein
MAMMNAAIPVPENFFTSGSMEIAFLDEMG